VCTGTVKVNQNDEKEQEKGGKSEVIAASIPVDVVQGEPYKNLDLKSWGFSAESSFDIWVTRSVRGKGKQGKGSHLII